MIKSKAIAEKKPFEWRSLFEGRMKWVTLPALCLLLAGACWWGYEKVTVMSPVEAAKSSVEEVTEFLGSERGLVRMSVERRYDYLNRTWQHYAQASPAEQQRAMQALERMTPAQRQVFAEAVAGVVKKQLLDGAKKYNSLGSAAAKNQFAQGFYKDLQQTRTKLTGGDQSAPGFDTTRVFRGMAGETPKEINSQILNNSTGSERAQAEPLVNKMAEIHKSEIQLSRGG